MANKIIFKNGSDAERLAKTPDNGEPIWITDTKKMYCGDGSTVGGNLISGGLSGGKTSTIHTSGVEDLVVTDIHNNTEIHLESEGDVAIDAANITDDTFTCRVLNTSTIDNTITSSGFITTYLRDGAHDENIITTPLIIKPNQSYILSVTNNGGSKFLNIFPVNQDTLSWTCTVTAEAADPDLSGATFIIKNAKYFKVGSFVYFGLSFTLTDWTMGRYILGSFNLPVSRKSTDFSTIVASANFSTYVPIEVGSLFGGVLFNIGSNAVRLPASGSTATVNITGFYEMAG